MIAPTERILNTFKIGDDWIVHSLDAADSTLFKDQDGHVIASIDISSDGTRPVLSVGPEPREFGVFKMNSIGYWRFESGKIEAPIETKNKDLIKAEMKVFKDLVVAGHIKIGADLGT